MVMFLVSYREAVGTCGRIRLDATPTGLRRIGNDTQVSRGGKPGLEAVTASRYLMKAAFILCFSCEASQTESLGR